MQTFDDLEKKWLDAHHVEYKYFTRLLLTFSVSAMTFLIAFQQQYAAKDKEWRWMALAALSGLLISSASGLLIQHRLMHNYLDRLERARRLQEAALKSGDGSPIKIWQKPTQRERWYYRIQLVAFFVSYLFLTLYAFRNLQKA